MNKYYNFKAADFIDDPAFRAWVYGKPQGMAVDWQQLGELRPSLAQEMEVARLFLQNVAGEEPAVSDNYIRNFSENIIRKHNGKALHRADRIALQWYRKPAWLLYMAAAVALAFGLGWHFLLSGPNRAFRIGSATAWLGSPRKEVNRVNRSARAEIILLHDGSKVTLQPNSSLTYPDIFDGNERRVELEGEAFFEVKRNPEQPFLVHFNHLTVKVLGTSFTIRSFAGEEHIRVTVKTGKVAVLADKVDSKEKPGNAAPRGVMLTANQEVLYQKAGGRFERAVALTSQIVDPTISEADFEFAGTPLSTVLDKLEKAYGIPILYDRDQVRGCSLTASLSDEPLLEKLNMICKTMDASYENADGQIMINVKSCGPAK